MGLDLDLDLARLAILIAGFAVYAWDRRGRGRAPVRRARLVLLVVLAATALASYYNFFRFRHYGGSKDGDAFTYYAGSKYFEELGYFGLYECTLAALLELGPAEVGPGAALADDRLPAVRDLRTLEMLEPGRLPARAAACRARFDERRWTAFRADVAWFRDHTHPASWAATFRDHGYHPTPVWTLLGGAAAAFAPAGSALFDALILADRLLIVGALACVVWAFGWETACLAAIVWGTGVLWSYAWIGDSYLRSPWLAATLAGLCCLRRERRVLAGALLATAAGLRLFPGIFLVGYLLHGLRRGLEDREALAGLRGLLAGAAGATALWLGAGLLASGHGIADYREFFEKISTFSGVELGNTVGLPVLVRELTSASAFWTSPGGAEPIPVRWMVILIQLLRLAIVFSFAARFWRCLANVQSWEAAAASFAWIPILTAPTNYYYGFVLAAALLAAARPRIGIWLLAAAAGWLLNHSLASPQALESAVASAIAAALAFAVVRDLDSSDESGYDRRSAIAATSTS